MVLSGAGPVRQGAARAGGGDSSGTTRTIVSRSVVSRRLDERGLAAAIGFAGVSFTRFCMVPTVEMPLGALVSIGDGWKSRLCACDTASAHC